MDKYFNISMPFWRFARNTLVVSCLGLFPLLLLYIALTPGFGSMLLTTVLGAVAIRFLPQSKLGRSFVLSAAVTGSVSDLDEEEDDDEVVDQIGTALSDLRPSGKVTVAGRRYDALAQLGFVPEGTSVQVVRRQGYQLVVKQHGSGGEPGGAGSTKEQA